MGHDPRESRRSCRQTLEGQLTVSAARLQKATVKTSLTVALPAGLPDSRQLTEKYRPLTLDAFVGIDGPKKILQSFTARPYPSAWFLKGESGIGKTAISLAVSKAIGAELYHVPSRLCDLNRVTKLIDRCAYQPMHGGFHFILIDEADKMTDPAQFAFLSALDGSNPIDNAIFFFTSNDSTAMEARFLSRCRVLRFDSKGHDEQAAEFLRKVCKAEGGADSIDFLKLFELSGRNFRTALNNLEMLLIDPAFEIAETPKPFIMRPAKSSNHRRPVDPSRLAAALKAWVTMRSRKA